jgi:hypothetical protein
MAIEAFDLAYDESGSGNILLVSLQLSTVYRAKKLKQYWLKQLRNIPFFHSKDFNNYSKGVFAGLDRPQRKALLAQLGTLIQRHLIAGFTTRINVERYNAMTTNDFRSRWGSAYTFSVMSLLMSAHLYFEHHGLPQRVNVLIENGHKNAAQALGLINSARELGEKFQGKLQILTASLGAKKDHPILQSADMLAYGEWQKMCEGSDLSIYNACHPNRGRYLTRVLDFEREQDYISLITEQADFQILQRKLWGAKRTL